MQRSPPAAPWVTASASRPARDAFRDGASTRCATSACRSRAFHFSATFGRNLEYYTGFVFQIEAGDAVQVAGGGRYDDLLSDMGAGMQRPGGRLRHPLRSPAWRSRREARHDAAHSRDSLQGPADGGNRGALRQGRLDSSAGFRPALSRRVQGIDGIDVAFLSAAEIAAALRDGKIDLGVTGEDLLSETIPPDDGRTATLARLGFGPADVVVAVPEAWLDVATMADLDDVSEGFYARHGRRLRVATKYPNLTRRFFAEQGRHRLSHRRKPGRHRRRAGRRHCRGHRRHHHDRRDARRQ